MVEQFEPTAYTVVASGKPSNGFLQFDAPGEGPIKPVGRMRYIAGDKLTLNQATSNARPDPPAALYQPVINLINSLVKAESLSYKVRLSVYNLNYSIMCKDILIFKLVTCDGIFPSAPWTLLENVGGVAYADSQAF